MSQAPTSTTTRAFTLVELSVVLVILGLLVGGIMAGQNLIRASELNALRAESQRYLTAMGSFREKYLALPGDMSTAVDYWGNTITGNGNGDGLISNTATAIGAAAATTSNEISNFWIHLASAGFIEGSYTAVANTTLTPGTNNPRSRINGVGWNVAQLGVMAANGVSSPTAGATSVAAATFYADTYGNVLLAGTGTNALLPGGFLKSEEAWNIDTKFDDGRPDLGNIMTLESQGNATAGSGCGNITGNTAAIAASSYDLTNTSATACAFVFKTGY